MVAIAVPHTAASGSSRLEHPAPVREEPLTLGVEAAQVADPERHTSAAESGEQSQRRDLAAAHHDQVAQALDDAVRLRPGRLPPVPLGTVAVLRLAGRSLM